MKILQINAIYGINSTGRTTKELHEVLISHGIESYVAAPIFVGNFDNNHFHIIGNKFDRKVHALLSRVMGKQGYYSIAPTRELIKWISNNNPDVVHLRNLHSNYINIRMLLAYLAENNIGTVITLHDCWFYTGKCVFYTEHNCDRWKYGCEKCPGLKSGNISWFFDKSSEMLKTKNKLFSSIRRLAVVGVSKWVSDECKISILKNADINTYVYNWINHKIFYPRKTDLRKKLLPKEYDYMILAVASKWNKAKGLYDLISSAKRCSNNVLFVLVGDIDEKNLQLPPNMINVGSVCDENELAEYYSAADIFIHLSIQETFGKVTAEALSCGTPVIAYNSTASPELVTEDTGYLVEVGDIEGVRNAINFVLDKGKDAFTDNCVSFARDKFDITKNAERYIDIYETLIKRN